MVILTGLGYIDCVLGNIDGVWGILLGLGVILTAFEVEGKGNVCMVVDESVIECTTVTNLVRAARTSMHLASTTT